MSIDASVNEDRTKLELIRDYLSSVCIFSDTFNLYFDRSATSQKQLARKLNVDPSTIAHWRRNRRIPSDTAQVFQIAEALNLGVKERRYLLRGWAAQRALTALIPYLEEAMNSREDVMKETLEDVKEYLETELIVLAKASGCYPDDRSA